MYHVSSDQDDWMSDACRPVDWRCGHSTRGPRFSFPGAMLSGVNR
jgi:hypothetical protein